MPDQPTPTDYPSHLRYLSGMPTDAEVQQLKRVVSDPEHKQQFMAFEGVDTERHAAT
ncbi:MAG: hypothetical protein R2824_17660 [Saprospiraceae bacterium]